jgi:HK97 family phage portal protein
MILNIGRYQFGFRKNMRPAYGESGRWIEVMRTTGYDPGWWQKDLRPVTTDLAASFHAFYACVTLIAGDIGKLRPMVIEYDADGLWTEVESVPAADLLLRPNGYQNHIQFKEWWIISKLMAGNSYAIKDRDARGNIKGLYLLNPRGVCPLVTPEGEIFYSLATDNLSGIIGMTVPASEIIHDRMNCLFHPLVGIAPVFACGIAARQGIMIQRDSTAFFAGASKPAGILTSPGTVTKPQRDEYRQEWKKFQNENAGDIAVLAGGLKFEPMQMTALDAQLVDQLKMAAETICSTFHVPAYKVGVGPAPLNNNVEALDQQYYSQCLQTLIESMELCLTEGIDIKPRAAQLDLDGLLRMDQRTQMETLGIGVDKTIITPNDARKKLNYPAKPGGDALYKQQQNFSLEALAKRDALPNPFVIDRPTANPTPSGTGPAAAADPEMSAEMAAQKLMESLKRDFESREIA